MTTDSKPTQPTVLADEALDDANGGIIAILIGLAKDQKPPVGSTTGGVHVASGDINGIADGTSNTIRG